MIIREYLDSDVKSMADIWNEIVEEGTSFPQEEYLTEETAKDFFAAQT